jgi:hypothetical protein
LRRRGFSLIGVHDFYTTKRIPSFVLSSARMKDSPFTTCIASALLSKPKRRQNGSSEARQPRMPPKWGDN